MSTAYEKLMDRVKDIGRLSSINMLLEWDQETGMPASGVTARAEQSALIAGLAHERLVADETKTLLQQASASKDDFVGHTNLRETRRSFERNARIPTELVKQIAHTQSLAKDAWVKARKESDFAIFAPLLSKTMELKRRVADHIGFETEPYDALMDEFEPGAHAAQIETLFAELRRETVALLAKIASSRRKPDQSILSKLYPRAQQEVLSKNAAAWLNFDWSAGRADVSTHPFCTTIGGAGDVRITTRYDERWLPTALYGTLHEVGHALYEQGLSREHMFTPMAEPVSMGIHESQSLMWENMVGRSKPFVTHHFDAIRGAFPDALGAVSVDEFYGAINTVTPSFIRVEADELTYNLHIVLRFEMERALLQGSLAVRDVPGVWNGKMKEMFGITPPNDTLGCLQDIHWSMGAVGYFPTYALGKLYAAQFFEQALKDIPDLWNRIGANDHRPLLHWLREKIHRHGRRYRAGELVHNVTGKSLTIQPFVHYVSRKFGEIYGF
jgi:carboxypeptidase Taq